mmetsp:Transcript_6279/g.17704  ORF Transcript_6279/g.17704 Transcript_6279/m.17704 type:complete len:1276 (+) Transcript_6279:1-3828(+)
MWPVWLMKLQMMIVYMGAAVGKLNGRCWLDGTAMYYISHGTSGEFGGVLSPDWLFDHMLPMKIMTWGAILVEFVTPITIWFHHWRWPSFLALCALHLGIELTMNMHMFEYLTLFGWAFFFIQTDQVATNTYNESAKRQGGNNSNNSNKLHLMLNLLVFGLLVGMALILGVPSQYYTLLPRRVSRSLKSGIVLHNEMAEQIEPLAHVLGNYQDTWDMFDGMQQGGGSILLVEATLKNKTVVTVNNTDFSSMNWWDKKRHLRLVNYFCNLLLEDEMNEQVLWVEHVLKTQLAPLYDDVMRVEMRHRMQIVGAPPQEAGLFGSVRNQPLRPRGEKFVLRMVICQDFSPQCKAWMQSGLCNSNPLFMAKNCPQSCDYCQENRVQWDRREPHDWYKLAKKEREDDWEGGDGCRDHHEECEVWAEEDSCETEPRFMSLVCPWSCDRCPFKSYEHQERKAPGAELKGGNSNGDRRENQRIESTRSSTSAGLKVARSLKALETQEDSETIHHQAQMDDLGPPSDDDTLLSNNMNRGGPGYSVANSATYSTDFNAEYFEVFSDKISTLYSEVHWRMHSDIPLPENIVERFSDKGSVMAILGYEVDQIEEGTGKQVPITWAYNHHYQCWLLNSKTTGLVKELIPPDLKKRGIGHSHDYFYAAERKQGGGEEDADVEYPQVHIFSEGNGGEMRLSYHGYPRGYAQLIESPDTFHVTPMQVDTWNREMKDARYVAGGPLPQSSRLPRSAGYSGLLECPCSDRWEKTWSMTYALAESECTGTIQNSTQCFAAARTVLAASRYMDTAISDDKHPRGCSLQVQRDGSTQVLWNELPSLVSSDVARSVHESSHNSHLELVAFATGQVNVTVAIREDTVEISLIGPSDRWFAVGFGSDSMCLHLQADECPTGGPYAIVVEGESIVERKLDYHGPGIIISQSVSIQSSSIDGNNRHIVMTRPAQGATEKHYSFDSSMQRSVPLIMALGCSSEFAQHCGHGPSVLNFLPNNVPTPLCEAGIAGSIGGVWFRNKDRCAAYPTGELATQQNPTCRVETYAGGLICCRDGYALLDVEQGQPWQEQPLEYRLKFRFYFEEYTKEQQQHEDGQSAGITAPSHTNLVRFLWMTEAWANEYDVPQCAPGTPQDQCVHTITSQWKVRDMLRDCDTLLDAGGWCTGVGSTNSSLTTGIQFIYVGPHCHAPSCLSMELFNADTGQMLCSTRPVKGTNSSEQFNEDGFLAIPPCLWGSAAEGLPEPVLLSLDTTLLAIKRNNNTMPHTGEMALWQMRGIIVPREK